MPTQKQNTTKKVIAKNNLITKKQKASTLTKNKKTKSSTRKIIDSFVNEDISVPHQDIFKDIETPYKTNYGKLFLWIIIIFIFIISIFCLYFYAINNDRPFDKNKSQNQGQISYSEFNLDKIQKFSSDKEFQEYIQNAPQSQQYSNFLRAIDQSAPSPEMTEPGIATKSDIASTQSIEPQRISQTNTQVLSIDEPDVVKTDGNNIYFSSNKYGILKDMPVIQTFSSGAMSVSSIMPPQYNNSDIKIIKALPVNDLEVLSKIDKQGEIFLSGKNLIIFSGVNIYNYDVSDPKNPKKVWDMALENGSYLVQSRLYNDKLYIVLANNINDFSSCPIKPFSISNNKISINCTDIYRPEMPISVDSTYTALKIDPTTGNIENKVSFIGSSSDSVVYMSSNNLYISYLYSKDSVKFFYDFIKENGKDIYPESLLSKVSQLLSYDISSQAKSVELADILSKYYSSLTPDEKLLVETESTNRMSDYYKAHIRDLEQTGIMRIALSDFSLNAAGNIPGRLLNQFSLDEYNNNLRVATTIGENRWFSFGSVSGESLNDVYILDNNLRQEGSVKDLGKGEKIYSVRFLDNNAYVVTFKQVDPFYVLDLKDPKNPQLSGELKIPGYSSYLHPISDNLILGIGQENNNVKLSLFDVSNPENPKELDKYILDEYWSEAMNNHRAFLQDKENKLFFIPGSKGAYIFSYAIGDKLSLMKTISQNNVQRAIYINNYLYIISDSNITVIDETDFKEINKLSL